MRRLGYLHRVVLALASACLFACGDPEGEFTLPAPDYNMFETQVMPILSRDCAFHVCHGARQRFFQVLGPGRPRLSPTTRDADPITMAEVQFNYQRAVSMIDRDHPDRSPLFMKPLDVGAGGAGHEGTDLFGRDVYASTLDPAFLVLQSWVLNAPLQAGVAAGQPSGQPAATSPATMPPGGP
ncbi:MAG: hypothetical protein OXU20_27335 [Myxococcales bacterium]|nr:hypothetical protein [Myxococcales bacterium]